MTIYKKIGKATSSGIEHGKWNSDNPGMSRPFLVEVDDTDNDLIIFRFKSEINSTNFLELNTGNTGYGLRLLNEVDYPNKFVEILNIPVIYGNGQLITNGKVSIVPTTLELYQGWGPQEYRFSGEGLVETTARVGVQQAVTNNSVFYPGMTEEDNPGEYYASSIFLFTSSDLSSEDPINPDWKAWIEFDYAIRELKKT